VLLEHGLADEVLPLVYPILSSTGKRFVLNGQIIPSVTVWERIAIALEAPLAILFYDEEGVLLLGTEKNLPGASYCLKPRPELRNSDLAVRRCSEGRA
jgi:hypothetical protein